MPPNQEGDAHLLGTREIVLLHHHDRGMRTFTGTEFARRLEERTGIRPDPAQDVRPCVARLRAGKFPPHAGAVRGFVLDEVT